MRKTILCLGFLLLFPASYALAQEESSCVACHMDTDMFDEEVVAGFKSFADGIHAKTGLSCHDCHGGNGDPALAEDMDAAKDETFKSAPSTAEVPGFCGGCHSDPTYIRRFKPDLRVDQEQEYWTSRHGEALKKGNLKVATCISCHGVHGIVAADDAASPVYPTKVADTCATCHANSEVMAELPGGRSLPTDQHARWSRSVHAAAMYELGDLTAPTCNDCHGNHGAVPPGVDSVSFICGQCHGREADLFRASVKHDAFGEHNEMVEGSDGCADCHTEEPQASLTDVDSFAECTTCHGNHGIVRPTVAMLSPLPETPCLFCHEGFGPLMDELPELEKVRESYEQKKSELLASAASSNLTGEDLFNWLVDAALSLPTHTYEGPEGELRLRPEFGRLFEKFRIGKTYYDYEDPEGDGMLRGKIMRCTHCHSEAPEVIDEPVGLNAAEKMLQEMSDLTTLTARAERVLLSARRGGVETREALNEIDQAVDAQISLEVLVHTFDAGDEAAFAEKHAAGLEGARAALAAGQEALEELDFRHQGLKLSWVFILLVLIGLALKIRQLS